MSLQITATLTCDGCGRSLTERDANETVCMCRLLESAGAEKWECKPHENYRKTKHYCGKCWPLSRAVIDSEPCCAKV